MTHLICGAKPTTHPRDRGRRVARRACHLVPPRHHTDTVAVIGSGRSTMTGMVVMLTRKTEEILMSRTKVRARVRAQARMQALPELMLWSIGTLLSAAALYLAWLG